MSKFAFRSALCCLLAFLIPVQLMAADAASAMLYANGAAWVNGGEVPKSIAVFAGDMVQTRSDSTVNISATGSSVMVLSESLVKFDTPGIDIEHGAVRISTSRAMEARAGEVVVKPAKDGWTEFLVSDVDGRMQIAALKGDVTIQDAQGTTTISQGQQTTRDDTTDAKKKKRKKGGAAPAASGGVLNSSWAIYIGGGAIAGVGIWALMQGDEPISPKCRTANCQ